MIQYQDEYLAFLKANGVGADSRRSYISYLNGVQNHLGISIGPKTLATDEDIKNIAERLKKETPLVEKTIKNDGSAMKQYVAMIFSLQIKS